MFFWGFDPTFILLIPAMIFAFWAQWKVQSTYQTMSRVRAANGMTGREMARAIMTRNGISDVGIEEVGGVLTDHYDPRAKKVRLSVEQLRGRLAGLDRGGGPRGGPRAPARERLRAARDPLGHRAGGGLRQHPGVPAVPDRPVLPLEHVAVPHGPGHPVLLRSGALPVRHAARWSSTPRRRALAQLTETGSIAPQEVAGAKKVLDAAALTYVAAAAMAALQLLRLVLLRNSRR